MASCGIQSGRGGVERRLPLISLPDADQGVGFPQIQFGEVLGLLECSKGRGDEWNRVVDRDAVRAPVVDAWAE